jgi:putative ABC transport system permease protein
MIELLHLSKKYTTGELVQQALDDVSLNLRDNEFVSIQGPSGSGKTTLLNIIGGLDHSDTGELIINGLSTKAYQDKDWDSYRNHNIGFVFQNYNLIGHQSVLENVELALTISGITKEEGRERAMKVLAEVGLSEHIKKLPNQLSGGQMQRVAIARAIVNDPELLLADEPTGALDSVTGLQIMELLKKIAENRLVVMVTHNTELAEKYSSRIISLKDGKIIADNNPCENAVESKSCAVTESKVKMSFKTALSLSFRNLQGKKGRTFLTAIAGSIGIIGIAIILALSSGVNSYVDSMQKDTMTDYPIKLTQQASGTTSLFSDTSDASNELNTDLTNVYTDLSTMQSTLSANAVENNLKAFKRWLEEDDNKITQTADLIVYGYDTPFSIYSYDLEGELVKTDADITELASELNVDEDTAQGAQGPTANIDRMDSLLSGSEEGTSNFSELLTNSNGDAISSSIQENYDLVYGEWSQNYDEVLLVMDENNSIGVEELYQLGLLSAAQIKNMASEIINCEQIDTLVGSYEAICQHTFILLPGETEAFEAEKGIELKISGIIRPKSDAESTVIQTPVAYTRDLTEWLIDETDISRKRPTSISIYTNSFEDKETVIAMIEEYNDSVSSRNRITYTDYSQLLTETVSSMVDIITWVLIAFVAISLIVSSIMIAIITHISVLERTKEIGILRAMGASKHNISRIFNAETILIGLSAGLMGVFVAIVLCLPVNAIMASSLGISGLEISLPLAYSILLIALSISITVIAGWIPAKRAANLDPIAALRSE